MQAGERLNVFIREVGFVPGTVVRRTGDFPAVKFDRSRSMERDLLIRKLFTSGHDTTSVSVSTWLATVAMLKSIWSTRAELPAQAKAAVTTTVPVVATMGGKLPPRSLVVLPRQPAENIAELVERRKELAA